MKQIIEGYEKIAEAYNEKIDHKPHNAYYDRPNTLNLIGNVDGKRILDAACGPGKYAEIFIEKGAEVLGFDLSPKMVNLAKERNGKQGSFFVQDMAEPFSDFTGGDFDIVVCALAMHYVKDWTLPLSEFHKVLRKGGMLVISLEHPFFEFLYFKSENYFEKEYVNATWNSFGDPVKIYSYRRSLQDCINPIINAGFQIDQIVEPLPVEEFKKLDPRHYDELTKFPAFMHIKAVK